MLDLLQNINGFTHITLEGFFKEPPYENHEMFITLTNSNIATLEHLTIEGTAITHESLLNILRSCSNLTWLDLKRCEHIDNQSVNDLLPMFIKLHTLSLSSIPLEMSTLEFLISSKTELVELRVQDCISDLFYKRLENYGVEHNPELKLICTYCS